MQVLPVHRASRSPRRIWYPTWKSSEGQRYLTLVVDHDTGRLVWAKDGRDKAIVTVIARADRTLYMSDRQHLDQRPVRSPSS
ncbi:MAG: hypothetical protein JWQ95_117 [Sphaerisporangium sp.]|nr:hypothetical protein [Sphaerisporangium sp.]